jgi:uncharacterized membrane protein
VSVAAGAGVVGGLVTGVAGRWSYAASVGWDLAGLAFLAWTWLDIGGMDALSTASHATREDPSKRATSVIVLAAAIASLVGVGFLLVRASSSSGFEQGLVAAVGVLSVAVSWLVVHTLFTLRYALLYYSAEEAHGGAVVRSAARPRAGVDFNENDAPRYADFAYLAFTIGMTFQVSDTDLTTKQMRGTALRHSLLSFLLGSVILASTVNLVASLAGSSH